MYNSYFWTVVTGSGIRTIRGRVTVASCVWARVASVLHLLIEWNVLKGSEGVQCISASPLLNRHWPLCARQGLLEPKGRVRWQQLSANGVVIRSHESGNSGTDWFVSAA